MKLLVELDSGWVGKLFGHLQKITKKLPQKNCWLWMRIVSLKDQNTNPRKMSKNTYTSEIKINVELDENRIPEQLHWTAEDGGVSKAQAKAVLLSIWDSQQKETLRIDLWTKTMMVDEMADFYYQTMMGMADAFERATHNQELVKEMKDFAKEFYNKFREQQLKENA